jgi:magnesium chelatase subunit D
MQEPLTYPFSAIVSLDDLRLALILNAINPRIGGLLVRGAKGSGKTTAVRALAQIALNVKVSKDCPFNCNPDDPSNMCDRCRSLYIKNAKLQFEEKRMRVVELPLGATEDRVVGSLNVEKAIKMGVEALEPGILADANQNILYVDEINLLPDHIADDLLDAAATGWNVVEREGISVKHPSRFIFIGTMNPEEGQIRPQLLDRLPLSVEVRRISDTNERAEVVKRNMEFEADPEGFVKKYGAKQEELKQKIDEAKKILENVKISDRFIKIISELCLELKVDGMRPDIVIAKTARTLAAFENRTEVTSKDILTAAELALGHRTREGGFLEPATPKEIKEALLAKLEEAKSHQGDESTKVEKVREKENEEKQPSQEEKRRTLLPFGRSKKGPVTREEASKGRLGDSGLDNLKVTINDGSTPRFLFESEPEKRGSATLTEKNKWSRPKVTRGAAFIDRIREGRLLHFGFLFKVRKELKHPTNSVGKRAEAVACAHRGRARGWKIPEGKPSDIHFPATIRTAARIQKFRDKPTGVSLSIRPEDVREKVRIYRAPMTMAFVLDLSESMLSSIDSIKEVMLKLHSDAYRYRDKVGIVAFKETGAVVVQHPTANVKMVANKLLRLRISGFTPLAAGMQKALEVLRESKRRDLSTIPVMVIVTDGDANVPLRRDLQTGEIREFNTLNMSLYKYEDEAIKDVVSVSQLIRKENVYTVVVNTVPISTKLQTDTIPTYTKLQTISSSFTTKIIASLTNGIHYELSGNTFTQDEELTAEFSQALLNAQKNISEFNYLSARAYLMHETRTR